jgi:glycosyltransferase 2 family protein
VFVLGAIAALLYVARRDLTAVRAYHWRIRPGLLAASLLLQVTVLVTGVYIWSRVLVAFNSPVSLATLFRMWALSNPIRYIPGSVWQLFAYGKFAGEARLSRSLVFSSLMVHIWLSIWAAVTLVLALAPVAVLPSIHFPRWSPLVIPLILIVIHPAVFNAAQRIVARILHREAMLWQGGWGASLGILVMHCVAWLAAGVAFAMFVRSIVDVSAINTLTLVAINSISFVAGYIVLFAPAGLGVRELTMSVLLGVAVPASVAVLVAVAARIWIVTAELVCALIALALPVRNPE